MDANGLGVEHGMSAGDGETGGADGA